MLDQFTIATTESECKLLPLEPNAWYGIRLLNFDGEYAWMTWSRGATIENLFRIMDFVKMAGINGTFIWIERLTPTQIQEIGL